MSLIFQWCVIMYWHLHIYIYIYILTSLIKSQHQYNMIIYLQLLYTAVSVFTFSNVLHTCIIYQFLIFVPTHSNTYTCEWRILTPNICTWCVNISNITTINIAPWHLYPTFQYILWTIVPGHGITLLLTY